MHIYHFSLLLSYVGIITIFFLGQDWLISMSGVMFKGLLSTWSEKTYLLILLHVGQTPWTQHRSLRSETEKHCSAFSSSSSFTWIYSQVSLDLTKMAANSTCDPKVNAVSTYICIYAFEWRFRHIEYRSKAVSLKGKWIIKSPNSESASMQGCGLFRLHASTQRLQKSLKRGK